VERPMPELAPVIKTLFTIWKMVARHGRDCVLLPH